MVGWLELLPVRIGIIATAFLGLVALRACDVSTQQELGAAGVKSKIERANANATAQGKRAAAGTADDRVRGLRDPTTRDD